MLTARPRFPLYLFLMAMLIGGGLFSTPASAAPPRQGEAEWLIMLYQIADDETLEQDIMIDLQEAEFIGSTDQVHIVSQVDRFAGGFDGMGDWTSTKRFYLTADDDFEIIASEEIEDMGEINMADGDVLVEFISWAVESYPAQRHALIMSDHGAGWPGGYGDPDPGILGDDDVAVVELTGGHDGIFLMELDRALTAALAETGLDQFELVGFDACLMGQLEVFTALAPHARYAVASEELEPGVGWAYAAVLADLANNPTMDGADLGQSIVTHYIDQDARVGGDPALAQELSNDITLAAIDLAAIPTVNQALDDFVASLLQTDPNLVAEARAYAQSYESVFGPELPSPSIDLGHFAQLVQELSPDAAGPAGDLLAAIEQAVVAEKHGPARPGSTGIAIHFPVPQLHNIANNFDYNLVADRFTQETQWDEFLATISGQGRRENFSRPQAQPPASPAVELTEPADEILEIPGIFEDEMEFLIQDIQDLAAEGFSAEEAKEILVFDYEWPEETIEFLDAMGVFDEGGATRAGPSRGSAVTKPLRVEPLTLSAEVATADDPVIIQTEISGDRLGYVFSFIGRFLPREDVLIIEDQDYIFADEDRELNGVTYPNWPQGGFTLDYEWEPIIFAIDDGQTSVRALFQPETYGESPTYAVEGLYTFAASGSSRYAKLFFQDGELVDVFGFTGSQNNGLGAPREITPQPGDQFTVWEQGFDLSDEAEEETYTREGGTVTFSAEASMVIEEIPAPSGNYVVGVIAEDLNGNLQEQYEGLFVVSDEAAAVDGFVPYVDERLQFALLYPETWQVEEDPAAETVDFFDEETGAVVIVTSTSYPDAASPLVANELAIQDFLTEIEADGELENLEFISEEPEDFVLGAFDGKIFEFGFELDGVPFVAAAIVATPAPETTYGLLALVPDETFDETAEEFEALFASFDVLISGLSKEQFGPPPPAIAGTLFEDDFSDPASGLVQDEEQQAWGRGYYAQTGQYVFELVPDPGAIYDFYLDETLPEQFLLQVTASYTGAIDNAYGLVFQLLPAANENSPDRFYTFRISGDGFYTVEKVGAEITPLIDWTFTGAINQGEQTENTLAVESLGDGDYNLYLNGQQIDSFSDVPPEDSASVGGGATADAGQFSYTEGSFGLIADNFDLETPATFRFDDLLVGEPGP